MPKKNPKVLIFTGFFYPGFKGGGPIRSVINLISNLSNKFDFFVVTSDRDLGDHGPYKNLLINQWTESMGAKVLYIDADSANLLTLKRIVNSIDYDVLYLNSFFGRKFSIYILFLRLLRLEKRRPVIVAPSGEFSRGALSLKKMRKSFFLLASKMISLHGEVIWQTSSEFEKQDLLRVMGKNVRVHVAGNLTGRVTANDDAIQVFSDGDRAALKVCFLSRISPMKNLDFALNVLNLVKTPVEFSIFGPKEDLDYWNHCQILIKSLPKNITANYYGGIEPDRVHSTIAAHDLFFLPTRGENFGHVIVEALGAGVPVLISDRTPWRNLSDKGVGWDLDLNAPNTFVNVIESFASKSAVEKKSLSRDCCRFAREISLDGVSLLATESLFRFALSA